MVPPVVARVVEVEIPVLVGIARNQGVDLGAPITLEDRRCGEAALTVVPEHDDLGEDGQGQVSGAIPIHVTDEDPAGVLQQVRSVALGGIGEASLRSAEEVVVRLASMTREVEVLEAVPVQVPHADAVHPERHRGGGHLDVHSAGVLDRSLQIRGPLQRRPGQQTPRRLTERGRELDDFLHARGLDVLQQELPRDAPDELQIGTPLDPTARAVGTRDPHIHPGGEQRLLPRVDADAVNLGLDASPGEGFEEGREGSSNLLSLQGSGRSPLPNQEAAVRALLRPLLRHEGAAPDEASPRHTAQPLQPLGRHLTHDEPQGLLGPERNRLRRPTVSGGPGIQARAQVVPSSPGRSQGVRIETGRGERTLRGQVPARLRDRDSLTVPLTATAGDDE